MNLRVAILAGLAPGYVAQAFMPQVFMPQVFVPQAEAQTNRLAAVAEAMGDLRGHTQLTVSLADVKDNFDRYGLLDDQVVFVKGWFSETLPALEASRSALMRLDGDLYESSYVALDALFPKLAPGGFAIIDDVNFLPPCRRSWTIVRASVSQRRCKRSIGVPAGGGKNEASP
jgi:Macrocin-O-methyltransferase (TylF)